MYAIRSYYDALFCDHGIDTTITVWVNPTPRFTVTVDDTIVCDSSTVLLDVTDGLGPVQGTKLYHLSTSYTPGMVTGVQAEDRITSYNVCYTKLLRLYTIQQGGLMNLLQSLLASLALNGIFFVFAAYLKTDVFTDITYSLSFVLLTAVLYLTSGRKGAAQVIASAMVILWGIRLGAYLFNRILHIKVDHRFDDKRNNPVRFGMFWLLQAVTVWVVMLPVFGILSAPESLEPPVWALAVSVAGFLAGFLIEAVADAQKFV